MRLETENVRKIERKLLDDLDLPDAPDESAAKILAYIDGAHTMGNLIIEMILELGGK